VAGLILLVVAALGPWFADTHPATAETCSAPLVWVGGGYCACLWSPAQRLGLAANMGQSAPLELVLCLPVILPFASTLLLLLGERRGVWIGHLWAWGLAGAYSLIWLVGVWHIHPMIWQWGAGLCAVVAAGMLTLELLAARRTRRGAAGETDCLS